jgi:streptogramin lyase
MTPAGVVTEFFSNPFATPPVRITAGAEGDLWVTEERNTRSGRPRVGRITPEGTATNFLLELPASPTGITWGREGDLWVAEGQYTNKLARVSPDGVDTEFPGLNACGAQDITTGPEGNLWFTQPFEFGGKFGECRKIGRMTSTGTITEFSTGITGAPDQITAGPDGNLWFTEFGSDRIGRRSPSRQDRTTQCGSPRHPARSGA